MPTNPAENIRKFLEIDSVEDDTEDDEYEDIEEDKDDDDDEDEEEDSPVDYGPPVAMSNMELEPYEEADDAIQDIVEAKKNINEVIQKANRALDSMISLAEQTDNPRAYEVLNQMLKTVSSLNKDFIDMTKAKEKIVGGRNGTLKKPSVDMPPTQNITNNNVVIASSKEFLRMIRQEQNDMHTIDHEDDDD